MFAGQDRVVEAGKQVCALGSCPRQRLGHVGQAGPLDRRSRSGIPTRPGVARQLPVGGSGGVLVVIEQPFDSLFSVAVRIIAYGESMSMLADQVVQPVAAAAGFGQQVMVV